MAIIKPNNNTISAITALPAAIPTGKVLQVVSETLSTQESTTSTSFVSTNLTASITPSSTSNKILILINAATYVNGIGSLYGTVYRGASNLGNIFQRDFDAGDAHGSGISINYLDSPSTTSSTTYTYYHYVDSPRTAFLSINNYKSVITLMEIAG